jgi:hypothetical protein
LFSNSEVKDLIFDLSSNVGFKSLQADGRYLMIQVGPDADDRQVVKDLYRLVKILKSLGPASKRSLVERIPFRLATAEILAYGIFGYAMAYFMDFPSWDVHVFWPELVPVISAATLFVLVLWGLCLKWFVGSRTKTGMVLLETGLLLLFAAPVWGYDVAASFNRRFDRSDALSMKLENLQLEERIIRQRGSVQRRYVLRFNPVVIGGRSISKLRVPQSVFLELQSLESTLLMVRKGFLGVHWIQRIGSTDIPIKKSQFLSPKA